MTTYSPHAIEAMRRRAARDPAQHGAIDSHALRRLKEMHVSSRNTKYSARTARADEWDAASSHSNGSGGSGAMSTSASAAEDSLMMLAKAAEAASTSSANSVTSSDASTAPSSPTPSVVPMYSMTPASCAIHSRCGVDCPYLFTEHMHHASAASSPVLGFNAIADDDEDRPLYHPPLYAFKPPVMAAMYAAPPPPRMDDAEVPQLIPLRRTPQFPHHHHARPAVVLSPTAVHGGVAKSHRARSASCPKPVHYHSIVAHPKKNVSPV